MWRSEDNLVESVISLHVFQGSNTCMASVLHLLSHLARPQASFNTWGGLILDCRGCPISAKAFMVSASLMPVASGCI